MKDYIIELTDNTFESTISNNQSLPVLVDFWADWCGPCQQLAPILAEVAKQHQGKLIVAKLDIEKYAHTAQEYHVRSIPTLLLFKQGKVVATQIGAVSSNELNNFLKKHL